MNDNIDSNGVARYPVGNCPIMDSASREALNDSKGRRSYTTSIVFGPSIGKNIALGYLPYEYAQEGRVLAMEYFNERYSIKVESIGYRPLYDPKNEKPKS